ncbi:MAG: hypothetical protein FD149_2096 [Rhodospirillaceae bacterium]|nr:MAG: hypothetical protein FD149_2096 [Rhodospirillaceae bacterium]
MPEKTAHTECWNNVYGDIRKAVRPRGFERQQGSVYCGDHTVNAVPGP